MRVFRSESEVYHMFSRYSVDYHPVFFDIKTVLMQVVAKVYNENDSRFSLTIYKREW